MASGAERAEPPRSFETRSDFPVGTLRFARPTRAGWYVLPTLPIFLVMPALLRHGVGFWPTRAACCALTFALYLVTVWRLAKFGVAL